MEYYLFNDGKNYSVTDGDTIADEEGYGKRVKGYDTYETYHPEHLESVFTATKAGDAQTSFLEKLIKEKGFTGIRYSGEQDDRVDNGKKRDIIEIYHPTTGQTTADVMYYNGLTDLRAGGGGADVGSRIDPKHRKLYLQGQRARANGETDEYYDSLRAQFIESKKKDNYFKKELAPSEKFFNPDYNNDVVLRHSDRDLYNHADNVLKSSVSGGVDSLQAGFWGFAEMLGNRVGIEGLEDVGRTRKEFNFNQLDALPKWTSDIHNVNNFDDFSEWFVGALGGSAPFFGLMAAGFIPYVGPIARGSMALIYAGQTVNDMKGSIDQKSFTKAIGAGLAMTWFERLGGKGIFGKGWNAKKIGSASGVKEMKAAYAAKNKMEMAQVDIVFREASKEAMILMMKDIKRNDVIWKIYAKSVAGRTATGAVSEAITEAAQEGTQYSVAYWGSAQGEGVFDKEEFRKLLENSAAAGFALGGSVGGTIAAGTESSPISTDVRQFVWDKTKNSRYDTSDPLDMAKIINASSQRNINREILKKSERQMTIEALDIIIASPKSSPKMVEDAKAAKLGLRNKKELSEIIMQDSDPANYKDNPEELILIQREIAEASQQLKELNFGGASLSSKVSLGEAFRRAREEGINLADAMEFDSNVEANDAEVKEILQERKDEQAIKPITTKTGEIIKDNVAFSSGYNVLKNRMGSAWKSSQVLAAEFSFSGFIHDRMASGNSHVQNRRVFEGRQHTLLRSIMQELRLGLGISGDREANRSKAYDQLREYVLMQEKLRQSGTMKTSDEWANFLDENNYDTQKQRQFERAKYRLEHEYEREQMEIYKLANPKYKGKRALHTLTERKVSNVKALIEKEKFLAALKSRGYSDKEAEIEYDLIENTPGGYNYKEFANTNFLTKKPKGLKRRNEYNPNDEAFQDLWEENTLESANLRATEIAHYTSDTIATGFGGDRLNSRILEIKRELTKEMGKEYSDKWMPEIAETIYNHYKAHRGEYNRIENKNLRAAFANAGALMALAYMPLAVFSSLPEIGLAFLGADKKMFLTAVEKAARMTGGAVAAQMRKIADSDINESQMAFALEVMRRRGMLTHEYGAGHVIDAEVGNDRRNWLQRRVMPAFYKITGLTTFTTAIRMLRGSIANDYIANAMGIIELALFKEGRDPESFGENDAGLFTNQEARAIEQLKEIGGDPRRIVIDSQKLFDDYLQHQATRGREIAERMLADPDYDATADAKEIEKQFPEWLMDTEHNYRDPLGSQAIALSRQIDMMRSNFVDAALVNPDPGKRPLFYSNGHVRLLVLFQGYLSVFSSQIIKPILKNLIGRGSPQEQVNAAAVMMSTIALGFIGQAIKDEIKYGDSPVWLSDAEYFQRGVMASGLFGQYERPISLVFPIYGSEADTALDRAWGEVGALSSTVDSAYQAAEFGLEGEGEKALNKLFKITPGIGVFTSARQKLADKAANLGD
jgi:hypothetical protein